MPREHHIPTAIRRGRRRSAFVPLTIGFSIAAVSLASAQYRVNPQLNTELYGRGVGSVRHAGLGGMPNVPWHQARLGSELRHDAFLSGRLPSEMRGTAMLRGPLAPTGAVAYIPTTPGPFGSMPNTRPYSGGAGVLPPNPSPIVAPPTPGVRRVPARSGAGGVGPSMRIDPRGPLPTRRVTSFGTAYPPRGSIRHSNARPATVSSPTGTGAVQESVILSSEQTPPMEASYGSIRHHRAHTPSSSGLLIPPVAPRPTSAPASQPTSAPAR
jgi:hypothetical protein